MKLSALLSALSAGFLSLAPAHADAPDLTGPITRSALEAPAYPWMKSGEAKARKDLGKRAKDVKKFAAGLAGTDVEIYLATWCSDSQDHVPVFFGLLDEAKKAAKTEPKSVAVFGLDKRKTYSGFANPRKIESLPTFVYLRDGKEIGRIVETPNVSVLDDSLAILSANASK